MKPTTYICKCGQCIETGKKHYCPEDNVIKLSIFCGYCGTSILTANHYWRQDYAIPAVRIYMFKPICDKCSDDISRFLYEKL